MAEVDEGKWWKKMQIERKWDVGGIFKPFWYWIKNACRKLHKIKARLRKLLVITPITIFKVETWNVVITLKFPCHSQTAFFSEGSHYPQFNDNHPFSFFVVLLHRNTYLNGMDWLPLFLSLMWMEWHYILIYTWLLLLNIIFNRLIHIIVCSCNSIFLWSL